MFTVKATYRNETRKFSFSGNVLFPTYEELYHQLYRIFPISHNYYLSKLIFSPDASKPGRVLVGKEVHNAEEYSTRIAPLRRRWPNPLLRFSIFDEIPNMAPSSTVEDSQEAPSLLSFMAIPPPPVLLTSPAPYNLSLTPFVETQFREMPHKPDHLPPLPSRPFSNFERPSFFTPPISPSFFPPPPPPVIYGEPSALPKYLPSLPSLSPQVVSPQPCCSVAKGKSEIEALLASFRIDFERIMINSFGPEYNSTAQVDTSHHQIPVDAGASNEAPRASSEAPCNPANASTEPPSSEWCHVCRNEFSGSCYGCVKCSWHIVCPSCFSKSGAMHTFCFGPTHIVQQREVTPPIAVAPLVVEAPAESQSTGTEPVGVEPIHRNIVCDSCNEIIVGVRHKCLDCPDYDLCTSCIESGATEKHNSFHEFFDIETPGRVFVHTVFSGSGERDASATSRSATADSPRTSAATSASTTEAVRHCASCNLCDSPIVGDRFKCVDCPDFDTCADCFKITKEQHPNHSFVRVSKTSDFMMRYAASNMVTHYATCDSCRKAIRGVRFKCMHPSCPDFDLCQNCEALPIPVHPSIHPLLKMKTPGTVVPTVRRDGLTNQVQPQGKRQGNTPPQTVESHLPKSPPVSVSRTASERSVTKEQEVVPESLSPLAILPQCPDCVSANPVATWGYGLTPAKLPQFSQSPAANCEETSLSSTDGRISDLVQTVRPAESQQSSAVDREQFTSPHSNLVQTITTAEVNSPPLDLSPSLDIFREVWPSVNREMKHLTEARRSEVDSSSSVADSDKGGETDLVNLLETTDTLANTTCPEESAESLLKEVSPVIPTLCFDVPPMIEPLLSADRDLAALLRGYRTPSPFASEAPAPSCTTFSALPDSVLDEQSAVAPSAEQARLPPLSCAFVSDTTVPDGQIFPPGAEFVKSWRMLNDGEKPWPETTELHFVAGESFSPEVETSMVAKVGRVDPGVNLDVWTGDLKAPDAPGRYVGYWRLTNGAGESFGANIWIDVTVTEPRQSVDEAEDHSLASSSMVMPKSSSNNRSIISAGPLGDLFEPSYPSTSKPATDVMDDGDSDGSSVSLVSVPSSDDYGSDWQDTRSQPENLEYVVLYDSNGSEDE
ncbi:hypothetical protein DEU56DRAFT_769176 [Suillus clintonianus]|uniref:uncharacterized protein n=1 Tax=Suillus clintonianus TaxID=1904413 RepID=UPI001B86BAE5|nr:uncharacterized protein DEU56DRAFT_769176 [Suillus clintonianus]KAG2154555.1 hypothetical protein DEU56DRAFT_769176 [Suillus clintonianus]